MSVRPVRLPTVVLLMAALCSLAPEAQQAPTPVRYFWSNGRRVPVGVVSDAVAVRSAAGAVAAAHSQVLPEVAGQNQTERAKAAPLAARGITIVKAKSGRATQLRSAIRASGRATEIGVAVDLGSPTSATRAYAVLTPEFIVRFRPGVSRQAIDQINTKLGAEIVRADAFVPNQFVLRVANGLAPGALDLSDQYFKLAEVDGLAHPNFIYPRETRSDPNDPLWPKQWHLNVIDAAGAWQITRGEDVIVAVIDPEGVEIAHEDLFPNLFVNEKEIAGNNLDDDNNGMVDDVSGWNFGNRTNDPALPVPHGTAAAAVALAACENKLGGCGVAPKARLLAIAQGGTVQDDADAFRYAMQMGASVISSSWGYGIGLPTTQVVEEAIADVIREGRGKLGTAVVFAMTNQQRDNFGGGADGYRDIASVAGVLAIGRSTDADRWGRSGFGRGMALLAPTGAARGSADAGCLPERLVGKQEVITADLMGPAGYNAGTVKPCFCNATAEEIEDENYTACFHGTSSATPLVAGVVALMMAANPKITLAAITDILADTAERIEPTAARYKPDANKRLYSATHGWGRVHAGRAVAAAAAWVPTAPPPPASRTRARPAAAAPAGAGPVAAQPGMKVAGKASEEVRVPGSTSSQPAYVWQDATALALAPGVSPSTVLTALEGTATQVSGYVWAQQLLSSRNVLVVEHSDAAVAARIADLAARGLVQGTGRVAFFDKAGRNVGVLLNHFSVIPNDGVAPAALEAEAGRHGFTLEARPYGRFELIPRDRARDALDVAARAEQFAKSPLVRPKSLVLGWTAPVERR
jgi:subtilisin family serine protease